MNVVGEGVDKKRGRKKKVVKGSEVLVEKVSEKAKDVEEILGVFRLTVSQFTP